jgi:hypothetical protein
MGNLLHGFVSPSLMDIKMGQRTYLHLKSNTMKKRTDLLDKMMKVDPSEASERAISYAWFRCKRARGTCPVGLQFNLSCGVLCCTCSCCPSLALMPRDASHVRC